MSARQHARRVRRYMRARNAAERVENIAIIACALGALVVWLTR